jgi:cytochrome P450 family 142 subfamily A polypeptide 1
VMFDELGRRLPDIELATDEPLEFRASNFIVGPESMPVTFTPTAKHTNLR